MARSTPVEIAIAGALGRMGRAVAAAVEARAGAGITAYYDRPGTEDQPVAPGSSAVLVTADQAATGADVIIDFTTPEATMALAKRAARQGGAALVLGATGLGDEAMAAIEGAAKRVPIVRSGNYSLGVNTLMGLVRQTAERLGPDAWDIEIFEAHHKRKVDAPSGTALMLGEAAATGRHVSLGQVSARGRDGLTGPRKAGEIGFSVQRGGGIVGEHAVSFIAEDEILTLSHSARDRSLFARGAVEAAMWVIGKPPGLYDMMDVLGFR